MTIKFFLPMEAPPTVTYQQHDIRIVNGMAVVYEPTRLKEARQKFLALLGHQLSLVQDTRFPISGPVRLVTKWIWPMDDSHQNGEWKITTPDTDNLIKLFKDCMTKTGWWIDDAQVASEITEKFWGVHPGIYVELTQL